MKKSVTKRGFALIEFTDAYGEKCSLQKSSSAEDDYVWLGIDKVSCKVMASKYPHLAAKRTDCDPAERFNGWVEHPLPDGAVIPTRMHLSREQAMQLAGLLLAFSETGELPC